jgi:hypothetical protein
MALRAKCSGLILKLHETSVVINTFSLLLKDRYEDARHEIGQFGLDRSFQWHRFVLLRGQHVRKL